MKYLEALKIVQSIQNEPALNLTFRSSGNHGQLVVFLKAMFAKHGTAISVASGDFGAIAQELLTAAGIDGPEIIILYPWDFCPEQDWRSGFPLEPADIDAMEEYSLTIAGLLKRRADAYKFYVNAPVPIVTHDADATNLLAARTLSLAVEAGAHVLEESFFSLAGYLHSGSPLRNDTLHLVAEEIWRQMNPVTAASQKVLVTDLDGVMWHGVIGEDGLDGIECQSEGPGFVHYIYQSLLKKLTKQGIVLAAVSRNDDDLARMPFKVGKTALREEDFAAIVASYNPKSSQIRSIAEKLNLGLDSFVFIDDNPVEIAEVSSALPEVTCLTFPSKSDKHAAFFNRISTLFSRKTLTEEDRNRTALYRRRLAGMPLDETTGADLTDFLTSLKMTIDFHDRSNTNWDRAFQLVNKTNQFNINGLRIDEREFEKKISSGYLALSASLSDRSGAHGEVIAALISPDGVVDSLVMSCRVFQRRMEYAFIEKLTDYLDRAPVFRHLKTERNVPAQQFFANDFFCTAKDGLFELDVKRFLDTHKSLGVIFQVGEDIN